MIPAPYHVLASDPATGETVALCITLTREDAQQIVDDLTAEHPHMRFGVVVSEEPE